MITVRFQIPGKAEDIAVEVVPRKDDIVKLWDMRWLVMEIIHDLVSIETSKTKKNVPIFKKVWVIWVSLHPCRP